MRKWLERRARRATVRSELEAYSDRELNDIGLSRTDIDGIVAQVT